MIIDLKNFIDIAEKDRKYVPNTATGFRNALNIFETELNEQEKESLPKLKENIDAIYMNVYRKNQKELTSKTLLEYKRRIMKLIKDYEQYGNDPNKMAAWAPAQRTIIKKKTKSCRK